MPVRPSFSVVVPTYNRWPIVAEAVQSVLDQTYTNTNVIVVDDGSTDGTPELLRERFPEVKVVRQSNAERGAARNHGVSVSDSTHVSFLDSDDRFEPDHIAEVAHALTQPNSAAVATAARIWNPETAATWLLRSSTGTTPLRLDDALWGNPVPPSCLTLTRELFDATGGFPEHRTIAGSEDWVFLLRILARQPVQRISTPSVLIRTHSGRSMGDATGMENSRRAATALLEGHDTGELALTAAQRRILRAGTEHFIAAHRYEAGDTRAARRALRSAMVEMPGWAGLRISWRLWALSMLGTRGSRALRRLRNELTGRS